MKVQDSGYRRPFIDLGGSTRLDRQEGERRQKEAAEVEKEEKTRAAPTSGLGRVLDRTV